MTERKPIKVTISEPDTGKVIEEKVIANDYVVITAGNRYVDGVQVMGKPGRATHIIAVKVEP